MKLNRFIRSQGDLDGACFLYTIFNCAQFLANKKLSRAAWKKLVETAIHPIRFLGNGGTGLIDEQEDLLTQLIKTYLGVLGQQCSVKLISSPNPNNLQKLVNRHSILLVDNGEHWFCIVDATSSSTYVACSAVWQENPHKYRENLSPSIRRVFNIKIPTNHLEFLRNRAFLVTSNI